MKWAIWSYRLPLRYPLAVLGEHTKTREGLIIGQKINDEWRYGEAAPLPSFHNISLQNVFQQIRRYFTSNQPVSSSVAQYAIDMLFMTPSKKQTILLNALSSGHPKEAMTIHPGFTSIKVKVGRRSLNEDRDHLLYLRDHMRSSVSFRLDANRLWDRDQAQRFIDNNQDLNIEYIEEPTQQSEDIQWLQGAHIALDESLDSNSESLHYPQVKYLIIKPTLQGGVSGLQFWRQKAKENQQNIILSSTFESSLGLWGLGHLAAEVQPNQAHGLGTLRWFEKDTTSFPICGSGPKMNLEKNQPEINLIGLNLEESNDMSII